MKLEGVFLFEYGIKDLLGCQLSILSNNKEFVDLLNLPDFEKINKKIDDLPDLESMIEDNNATKAYKTTYKYTKINNLKYPEIFIEKVNSERGNFPLKDVDSMYEHNIKNRPYVPYNSVLYVLKDENSDIEYVYIYKLGVRALMTNHKFYFGKMLIINNPKVNSSSVKETTIFGSADQLLSLPVDTKDCVAVLEEKRQ